MSKYKSSEYTTYWGMKERCLNPNNLKFEDYGGRGIKICKRWLDSFENFLEDMGERPIGLTLERINNDKGYSPNNCKWAGMSEQMHNTRIRKNNTTGYRGIYKNGKKWSSQIIINGKYHYLGSFKCKHEAAMLYDMFKEKNQISPYGPR